MGSGAEGLHSVVGPVTIRRVLRTVTLAQQIRFFFIEGDEFRPITTERVVRGIAERPVSALTTSTDSELFFTFDDHWFVLRVHLFFLLNQKPVVCRISFSGWVVLMRERS